MLELFDTVVATKDLEKVPKGTKGAIFEIYNGGEAYEVE